MPLADMKEGCHSDDDGEQTGERNGTMGEV